MLTDKDSSKVQSYLYTPFGESWVVENGVDTGVSRLFTGQEYDQEIGLYYYNARYYDPDIAVFITPDPAMEGLNHYAYANSNPIKYNDPTGLYMRIAGGVLFTDNDENFKEVAFQAGYFRWEEAAMKMGVLHLFDDLGNWQGGTDQPLVGRILRYKSNSFDSYTQNNEGDVPKILGNEPNNNRVDELFQSTIEDNPFDNICIRTEPSKETLVEYKPNLLRKNPITKYAGDLLMLLNPGSKYNPITGEHYLGGDANKIAENFMHQFEFAVIGGFALKGFGFRGPEYGSWKTGGNWQSGWHFHLGNTSGLGKHHLPQQIVNWAKNFYNVLFK